MISLQKLYLIGDNLNKSWLRAVRIVEKQSISVCPLFCSSLIIFCFHPVAVGRGGRQPTSEASWCEADYADGRSVGIPRRRCPRTLQSGPLPILESLDISVLSFRRRNNSNLHQLLCDVALNTFIQKKIFKDGIFQSFTCCDIFGIGKIFLPWNCSL